MRLLVAAAFLCAAITACGGGESEGEDVVRVISPASFGDAARDMVTAFEADEDIAVELELAEPEAIPGAAEGADVVMTESELSFASGARAWDAYEQNGYEGA